MLVLFVLAKAHGTCAEGILNYMSISNVKLANRLYR